MNTCEVARRFFDVIRSGTGPRNGSTGAVASLYGTDEVTIDTAAQTVTLRASGASPIHRLGIGDVVSAGWYATTPIRSDGGAHSAVVGFSDPHDAKAGKEAPQTNWHLLAVPASEVSAITSTMNRARRRAMKR